MTSPRLNISAASGSISDLWIVEVPNEAVGSFTLAVVESPDRSQNYEVRLIKNGAETTMVAKVTKIGVSLNLGGKVRIFRT